MHQFLHFIILTFIYSSTCFGRPHAHHQELNNCSSSLWFYLRSVVIAVLLVVVWPARTRTTALLSPRSNRKTRGCYCSCWAPDDGRQDARNMLDLVGDLFEFYDDARTYKLKKKNTENFSNILWLRFVSRLGRNVFNELLEGLPAL